MGREGKSVLQDVETGWSGMMNRRDGVMLGLISAGIGLHAFNQFAIVAALPPAAREIGGAAWFSWAYTLYFLGSIGGGTGAAALRDRFGVEKSLIAAVLVFAVGGLLALAAPHFAFVVAGRLLQGIGDGLIVAICYSLIPANFPSGVLARVFAVEAVVWAVAAIAGPLAGGVLTELLSWRAAFLAVAPFVLILPVLTLMAKPKVTPKLGQAAAAPLPAATIGLCLAGAFVLSLASVAGTGLERGLAIVAGAAIFLAALGLDGRIGPKLFPRGAFRPGSVLGHGFWVLLLMSASHSAGSTYIAVMIGGVWGFRPSVVGYLVVMMAITWSVVAVVASRVTGLGGRHLLMRSGALFQFAGFAALGIAIWAGSVPLLIAGQMAVGTGFGISWAAVNQAAMEAADSHERDLASALLPTISTAGYAIGSGLAGTIAAVTGLVDGLGRHDAGAALWLYGTAAAGALITFLFGFGVRLREQ